MGRCACQLAANELLQRFPALSEESRALRPLAAFLTSSADMVKLQRFMGSAMRSFDPALACSPMGVFCVARPRPCSPLCCWSSLQEPCAALGSPARLCMLLLGARGSGCALARSAWRPGRRMHSKRAGGAQGAAMVGRVGEGVPMEGATESLVERVVSFLAQSRRLLRSARAQALGRAPGGARLSAPASRPASRRRLTAAG